MKNELTAKEIEEFIKEVFTQKKHKERKIVMYQGCKKYGWANRSEFDLNLCDDPECPSCRMWDELIAKEAKYFLDKFNKTAEPITTEITLEHGIKLELIHDPKTMDKEYTVSKKSDLSDTGEV